MTIDYPWYMVLLCLLAGAAYAGVLYFLKGKKEKVETKGKWVNILLAAFRFLSVSTIAFLLLAPMTRRTVHERQKPHVVLAMDRSASVMQSQDSAFSFGVLADDLEKRCRVTLVTFGDAAQTDIGSVIEECAGSDVDALVLATDGIYNRGPNPVAAAERLAIPVCAVMLGDTTPQRDAALGGLRTNRVAMLGGMVPVEFTVGATMMRGRRAQLTVSDAGGHRLHSQVVTYDGDDYSQTVSVQLPAREVGLQGFTVRLTVDEAEVNRENNTLTFYVDVIDTRRKVAIVADAPHPDVAALKHAIESNPNYEATAFLNEKGVIKNDKWDDYSLVILHNLPSRQHNDISFASGLPQMFIIGLQTDLSRFNALHAGLEIVAKTMRVNDVTAIYRPSFSLFNLDESDALPFEKFPPLSAPFGEARMAEGVQTLFAARLGSIDTRQPIVAVAAQGEQRRVFVWGEGLWRWRLADYAEAESHDRFDRMVQQLVAVAAMNANKQRLRVEAERAYEAGLPIILRAQLYNEVYEPTNTAEVALKLNEGQEYIFHREGEGYSLTLSDLEEGVYRYRASTADGLSAEGSFAVEALGLEQRRLVADHGLLRAVTQTTGGVAVTPSDIQKIKERLSELKPTIYSHTRYTDLLALPLVLILLVGLLVAEWFIRKWNGEV